jgi:hypothetical protein
VKPSFEPAELKKVKLWELAIRFAYGGFVTACTGLVAKAFGPVVGGVFLGFPAILPATLTLVKEHDGRQKAVDDARGARLGTAGLTAFALTAWLAATTASPAVVLATALFTWVAVNAGIWAAASWRTGFPKRASP